MGLHNMGEQGDVMVSLTLSRTRTLLSLGAEYASG